MTTETQFKVWKGLADRFNHIKPFTQVDVKRANQKSTICITLLHVEGMEISVVMYKSKGEFHRAFYSHDLDEMYTF